MKITVIKGSLFEQCKSQAQELIYQMISKETAIERKVTA